MPTQAHTPPREIEPLESRVAPASITFTDIDGVSVTISSSKGSVAQLTQVAIFAPEGAGQELQELRLIDLPKVFKGANISVIKGTLEDAQLVNIGFIDAVGIDLGKITIDGDLGRILAGDTNSKTAATKALTAGSMGTQGLDTQAPGGDLISKFLGKLGKLTVNGDFKDASLTALGIDPDPDENVPTGVDARGDIGNISIGGDLIGGGDLRSGSIYAKGSIGNITVTGSVLGGTGNFSGSITSERKMGKVTVGGNIAGGLAAAADFSARIFSEDGMGSVNVTGNLQGGNGEQSGSILTNGALGNVTILGNMIGGISLKSGTVGAGGQIGQITIGSIAGGGDLQGGAGEHSGGLLSGGSMKAVKIFGNIVGGNGMISGSITSAGKIASLFVDGSITGGAGDQSGVIGSSLALGAVNVQGDLVGGGGKNSGNILSTAAIDSVNLHSVIGGTGEQSGAIGCIKTLGPVVLGGDLQGGAVLNAGSILSGQRIVSISVGGSVIGSTGPGSGVIDSAGEIGAIAIKFDLKGGSGQDSGTIHAAQRLTGVTIDGNLNGGIGANSAMISAGSIGSIVVKGDLVQGIGSKSSSVVALNGNFDTLTVVGAVQLVQAPQEVSNQLQFSSAGRLGTATFGDIVVPGGGLTQAYLTARDSIGKVTVEGSARYFHILAGYGTDLQAATSKANIGQVIIGTTGDGNIEGVDIVAGILPGFTAGTDIRSFGTEGDRPIPPFNDAGIAQIDSVVIKGTVIPTNSRADHYGIVAGRIGAVSIAGSALALTPGIDVIDIQPTVPPGDFTVREVSFKALD